VGEGLSGDPQCGDEADPVRVAPGVGGGVGHQAAHRVLAGAADTIVVVSRPRGESDGLLAVTSRDALEGEYAVTFAHARWTLAGADLREAAEEGRRRKLTAGLGDRSAEILAIVQDHPDGITPAEVAEKLGTDNDAAGQYLRRLVKIGLIDKAGRGVYLPRVRLSEVSEGAVKRTYLLQFVS
jgi:Winged helix-turn-helix DNA-binding